LVDAGYKNNINQKFFGHQSSPFFGFFWGAKQPFGVETKPFFLGTKSLLCFGVRGGEDPQTKTKVWFPKKKVSFQKHVFTNQ